MGGESHASAAAQPYNDTCVGRKILCPQSAGSASVSLVDNAAIRLTQPLWVLVGSGGGIKKASIMAEKKAEDVVKEEEEDENDVWLLENGEEGSNEGREKKEEQGVKEEDEEAGDEDNTGEENGDHVVKKP